MRLWQIDCARGMAVLAMIIFHIIFQTDQYSSSFQLGYIFYDKAPMFIATPFLILVGMGLWLGFINQKRTNFNYYVKRGLKIFGLGCILTLFSKLYPTGGTILFGILHCIGVCIIFSFYFLTLKKYLLFISYTIIFIGIYLYYHVGLVNFPYLIWLNLHPNYTMNMIDFYPLFPWFGVCLFGIYLGRRFFPEEYVRKDNIAPRALHPFVVMGKHSLVIYFVHQPLIVGILELLNS